MEIPKNVKETLESLSKVNLDFLSYIEKNPACLQRENFSELEEMRDRLHFFQSWPTFLGGETKRIFQEAGINVFNLIKSIPQRLFANDSQKMSAYYELPVSLVDIQMEGVTPAHLDNLLSRGDYVYSASGLKCMEYNIASNLGGHLMPMWEEMYLKNPLIAGFLSEQQITIHNSNLFEEFLINLMHAAEPHVVRSGGSQMVVCISFPQAFSVNTQATSLAISLNATFESILKRDYPSLSGHFFIADYPELEIAEDRVYFQGKEIHAILEWHLGVVPPRLMKAFKAGNIAVINGPVSNLLSAKSNLALLSDFADRNSDMFTHKEREIIHNHIPWTRKMVPGETTFRGKPIRLEEFIFTHKDDLVIKPSLGTGGDSVYIGKITPPAQWAEKVKAAALRKNWVVQEVIESSASLYQHGESGVAIYDMVWGLLVFGPRYAATFLRVILKKDAPRIVNSHQGAQISIVFDVDE